jgi:hypothetical protein
MELSDRHIEAIKEAARGVNYGSITIHIALDKLELNIQKRFRFEKEANEYKDLSLQNI